MDKTLLNQKIKNLSGGQKTKLRLARQEMDLNIKIIRSKIHED